MTEIIKSRQNPKVQRMRKLCSDGRFRRETGEFVCEGNKLLKEAIYNRAEITCVLYCGSRPDIPGDIPAYETAVEIIEYASAFKTPQDVLFSCRCAPFAPPEDMSGTHILLENVQDPGNVGTVIRTAAALGIKSVMLMGDCSDPYSPKCVRATMGAIFRQRVLHVDADALADIRAQGIKLIGAALSEDSGDVRKTDLDNTVIAIGNEGTGLTRGLLDVCDGRTVIPMSKGSESLNAAVAASVIMWEAARRRDI